METIRVNMTPCEDVQTIHASQNDNEAREWGFELHNNGEKIDSSSISDQLVFKAYKGGTEQLLPENTSTPTTSPFKGDIKYPQGLLTDQEFLYRQSPTEKDGLAKITDIKGNTLVWNQLVQNGNFADTSGWIAPSQSSVSLTANNNSLIIHQDAGGSNTFVQYIWDDYSWIANHKYLITVDTVITNGYVVLVPTNTGSQGMKTQTSSGRLSMIWNAVQTTVKNCSFQLRTNSGSAIDITLRNFNIYDLTAMFDTSKADEIYAMEQSQSGSGVSYFRSLFPLSFYDYNQGTLLSFNGNGIKTVSKNQFDTSVITTSYQGLTLTKTQGTIRAVYSGGSRYAGFNFYGSPVFTDTFLKGKYRLSFDVKGLDTQWTVGLRQGASFLGGGQAHVISNDGHYSFTINTEANPNCYLSFARTGNKTTAYDVTFSNIQLELGTTETSYTPFEEQTISLPISQYFPDGMDGINDVRDEKNKTRYAKRIGRVDLGNLNYNYAVSSGVSYFFSTAVPVPAQPVGKMSNLKCSLYTPKTVRNTIGEGLTENMTMVVSATGLACFRNDDITSASAFKTAMSGVYLYYVLVTPLENYGVVDMGTLDWGVSNGTMYANLPDAYLPSTAATIANAICTKYITSNLNYVINKSQDKILALNNGQPRVNIYDSAYTDATAFKTAMSGVYLYYELATPTETSFTTASLVTENAEIPLSNNDGTLIGKCTEQLSENPGFIDAKIKLADSDGECYSNKIQLHVERSPQ